MNKLKSNKSDGNQGFDSDHLLNCTPKLVAMLSLLFNIMITHDRNVKDLLFSNIISISKNMRSSLCSSSNYREISLCSSICKVLDMAIMEQFGKYLCTSDWQFGFKPGISTTMCRALLLYIWKLLIITHAEIRMYTVVYWMLAVHLIKYIMGNCLNC